ncbi:hypothetical protein SLA2020_451280 [Shorea laevis]
MLEDIPYSNPSPTSRQWNLWVNLTPSPTPPPTSRQWNLWVNLTPSPTTLPLLPENADCGVCGADVCGADVCVADVCGSNVCGLTIGSLLCTCHNELVNIMKFKWRSMKYL